METAHNLVELTDLLREASALLSWYKEEGIDTLGLTETLHVEMLSDRGLHHPLPQPHQAPRPPHQMPHSHKKTGGDASHQKKKMDASALKAKHSNSLLSGSPNLDSSHSIPTHSPPLDSPEMSHLSIEGSLSAPLFFLADSWLEYGQPDDVTAGAMQPGEKKSAGEGSLFLNEVGALFLKILGAMRLRRETICLCTFPPLDYALGIPAVKGYFNAVSQELVQLLSRVHPDKPPVICTLGDTALKVLLGREHRLSRFRGQFQLYRLPGKKSHMDIAVMPTYHPVSLLEAPQKKRDAWNDMQQIMARIGL